MKTFQSVKVIKLCRQINTALPEKVLPLLCPVREADWLEHWQYRMIYSKSGVIEAGCVFATPHIGEEETIWTVTHYDPVNYQVEFARWTPGEMVVQIRIALTGNKDGTTYSDIEYEYTSLNAKQSAYLKSGIDEDFLASMDYWEKAINHYLTTGKMLKSQT